MKSIITALGYLVSGTAIALSVANSAQAQTLSQQAARLTQLDPDSSAYQVQYEVTRDAYDAQATEHSLSFSDWLAVNAFVNNERAAYGSDGARLQDLTALNVEDLTWEAGANDVNVFFINEGAGYHNKFGYSTTAPTIPGNDSLKAFWDQEVNVIWEDASSQNSILANGGPLALGQGAQLDDVAPGETLNFFLRNPHSQIFDGLDAENTLNGDGLQHVTTYQYEHYLVLAYEDLYHGGDRDYNDVVIVVEGLKDTAPESVPEHSGVAALFIFGLVTKVATRHRFAPVAARV